jgi:hypothetical protein
MPAPYNPDGRDEEEFYAAIGAAVMNWQAVESEMAYVFGHLLASRAGIAATGVFYHIKNNKTRLEILDIAARLGLGFGSPKAKSLLAEWRTLSTRLTSATALRNKIAHSQVEEELTQGGWKFGLRAPTDDYSRFDPDNPRRSRARAKSYAINFQKIGEGAPQFMQLSHDLNAFATKLFAFYHPRAKLPTPAEKDVVRPQAKDSTIRPPRARR